MNVKTLIFGSRSNLSKRLHSAISDSVVISSSEVLSGYERLAEYQDTNIKIIFNLFYPALKLNDFTEPVEYIKNSIVAVANLLQQIKLHNLNVEKLIYTSSASVYGINNYCTESDNLMPLNLHASLKISSEKLIEGFCKEQNINFTIARLFNMYGGDDMFSIISKIIKSVRNNKDVCLINNGLSIRDFIHIDDVVNYYIQLLDYKSSGIMNIASGEGISVKMIISYLELNGYNVNTKNVERKEIKVSIANLKKLRHSLEVGQNINVLEFIKYCLR